MATIFPPYNRFLVLFATSLIVLSARAQVSEAGSGKKAFRISSKEGQTNSSELEFKMNRVNVNVSNDTFDHEPPLILLESPLIKRGAKIIERNDNIFISGVAEDQSEISYVQVNNKQAKLTGNGRFRIYLPLNFGDNVLEIEAVDRLGNVAKKEIIVERSNSVDATISLDANNSISWQSPVRNGEISSMDHAVVQACLKSALPIQEVSIYNNGWKVKSIFPAELHSVGDCNKLLVDEIELQIGSNAIRIEVRTTKGYFNQTMDVIYNPVQGKYHALIIAVEDYQDPRIVDLEEPINDADKLKNVLVNNYQFEANRVQYLRNPTKADIIKTLHLLRTQIHSEDNLLIFFAGHGYWDEGMNTGYWLPADAEQDNPVNWIPNTDITNYLGSIKSKHTLLIADACFSGGIFKTRKAFTEEQAIKKLYDLPSRKAMTSGTLKEVPDQSVFMNYLIKRLQENTETYLPAEQLFTSFKLAVLYNSPNVPQYGTIQNVGDEGGDFIFIKKSD